MATNLRSKGYSSSLDNYIGNASTMKANNTQGKSLTQQAYPASYDAYARAGGDTSGVAGVRKTTGSSSGSGSSGGSANASALYSALLGAYQNNNAQDYYNQMRAAAQSAYDRGMNALNSAYDSQLGSLSSNLDSTKGQLLNAYNQSKQNINDDAESSLKQAYINNMLSLRNLGQQMSAQGLTGGAAESTIASMLNNYGNARNNINTTANKNLSSLESNYNDNLASAIQAYNSAVAQAQLQKATQAINLENALANNQISALGDYQSLMQAQNSDYIDLLKTVLNNAKNFNYDPTQVLNSVKAISAQQAGNGTNANTNAAAVQALQNLQSSLTGGNTSTYSDTAIKNYLADILAQYA